MRYRFQFRRYRLPFRNGVRTAHGPWIERDGLVVRLEDATEGGTSKLGWGEAAPIPWFGTETVDEAEAAAKELGEWITAERLTTLPSRLGCLRAAVQQARTEIERARANENNGPAENAEHGARPRLANGSTSEPSATSGQSAAGRANEGSVTSGGPGGITTKAGYLGVAALLPAGRAALALIAPKADVGFRVFKWKVGVGDVADELSLLDDLCAALPTGAKLRLDANGAWDRRKAERWLERCADRPIEFVEQPCFAARAEGERALRQAEDVLWGLAQDFPTPLALDESLVGDGDVERWVSAGWPGVFVLKSSLLGDLAGALARLEAAKAEVVFSSALETAIGARAALRTAFAWEHRRTELASRAAAASGTPTAKPAPAPVPRALGFGVWPLFGDARFDGPAAAPFVRAEDVERIDPEAVWNALT